MLIFSLWVLTWQGTGLDAVRAAVPHRLPTKGLCPGGWELEGLCVLQRATRVSSSNPEDFPMQRFYKVFTQGWKFQQMVC